MNQENIALVTGASSGIGLALTRRLLGEGWTVLAMVRSDFPADDRCIQQAASSGRLRLYKADLADYNALKQALDEIKSNEDRIDVLFSNAGGSFPELLFSKQGRELHFELQTVVPYIIFMELKELLKQGKRKTMVGTSSSTANIVRRFLPEELEQPRRFKPLFGPYANSKLALSLWIRELAPAAEAEGLLIRSADPGGNNTMRKNKKSGLPWYMKIVMKLMMSPPTKGASLLYDAAFGKYGHDTGVFLSKNKPAQLKFTDKGRQVLDLVHAIYEREFLERKKTNINQGSGPQTTG
ncbi:SDR family NAD(P)-dependent oxidoreductase [Paenibacillus chibensis]|uniref:SDR family NAD(P)-dependent oxidoreductase n=1 Tax=Paenibacillus chibensis TaxID=59846 RepID=UPI000FD7B4E9|nr:SDR family NAD(P)-dependent oxidoreductase [Paenibacillus chibensis]MEC0369732.1 SDR family NAD(P)-dependent oxidoreductase [Paenibacillus chibensis]